MNAPAPVQRPPRRAVLVIGVLLAALALLTACVTERTVETDPTLEALQADPMGTWTPEGFSATVVTSAHAREHRGITNPKPGVASWTRVFTSTDDSASSHATLYRLAAAAEDSGWQLGYTGPADISATKTVNGEPAVLYATIVEPATNALKPSEVYRLHLSLQS